MRFLLRLALLLPLAAARADAATIFVTFEGTITEIDERIADGTFEIGEPVSGSFAIDSEAVDLEPLPDAGDYYDQAVSGLAAQFGDYPVTAVESYLYIRDRAAGADEIGVTAEPAGAPVGGLPIYNFSFILYDTTHTVFSSDAIPASLELADFDSRRVSLSYLESPFSYPVSALVTSLTYAVPEPAGAASAAGGALALLALGRTALRATRSPPARPPAGSPAPAAAAAPAPRAAAPRAPRRSP